MFVISTGDLRGLCSLSLPGLQGIISYNSTWDWRGLCPVSLPRIGADYVQHFYLGLVRIMSYISTWDWGRLCPVYLPGIGEDYILVLEEQLLPGQQVFCRWNCRNLQILAKEIESLPQTLSFKFLYIYLFQCRRLMIL